MKIKDVEGWQSTIDNNKDPYGAAVMQFAERWADLMEVELSTGKTVKECAKETSRRADTEGITGFMYGCAVSILAKAWEHGEELRIWNNLDLQIGNEGEKANETGGVLNPALLSFGVKNGSN